MRDLPPRLDFERTVAGQRLVLPRRRLGKTIAALLFTTLFGGFFAGMPLFAFVLPAIEELRGDADAISKGFSVFGLLFCVPFLVIGSGVALVPWLALLARTTIYLEHDEIRVFCGVGPIGFSRRRTTRGLAGFEVEVGTSRTNDGPTKPMKNFATLIAKYDDNTKPLHIAVGRPRDFLHRLAESLRETLQPHGWTSSEPTLTITESLSGQSEARDKSVSPPAEETIPDQPAFSKITVEDSGQRTIYDVPPRGLIRGSHGLWFFALFWNAITWFFVWAAFIGDVEWEGGEAPPWYFIGPFLSVFVIVGLIVAYLAARMGTRRARFEIDRATDPPTLRLTDRHWLGHTVIDLHPGDLTAVRVAFSGMESNDRPVQHLKLHVTPRVAENLPKRFRKKREIGLFVERKEPELQWLAARLRKDLKVPAAPYG
ncbi:MAG: hypothetical protein AAGE65_07430 [Planctomycetota bacterium]